MSDERKPVTHELKTWPIHFKAVESGAKPFELRRNDRGFHVGDILRLKEYDNKTHQYTGREEEREITYMLGLADFFGDVVPADECGYVILGLAPRRPPNLPLDYKTIYNLTDREPVWRVDKQDDVIMLGGYNAWRKYDAVRYLYFAANPSPADIEAARKEEP